MRIPLLSGRQVLAALQRLGFVELQRRGSHVKMEHPEIVQEMLVIGPPKDMDDWVKAWNEVKAA